MKPSDILTLISEKYGDTAEMRSFEQKSWYVDGDSSQTWRDHLTRTFSIRLKHSLEHECDPEYEAEVTKFLNELGTLESGAQLFVFVAISGSTAYSGWATEKRVIHLTRTARNRLTDEALE